MEKSIFRMQDELKEIVQKQYRVWFETMEAEISLKREATKEVYDTNVKEGNVRIPLVKKNIEIENAIFLQDEIAIQAIVTWISWENIQENINKVLKYDYSNMWIFYMWEKVINHNAFYWLSATVVDSWDNEEKQPINWVINPLNLIIDPNNYSWSKCRFIWVRRRVSEDFLDSNIFNKKQVEELKNNSVEDSEITRTQERIDSHKNQRYVREEWLFDIYDHFMIWKWKKILTTWSADIGILIRYEELAVLTEAEKLCVDWVEFMIQLHRRKPQFWRITWTSIVEEVKNFQDIVTQLTNNQLKNARINSLWPDMFIDDQLWLDTKMMSRDQPWARVFPVSNKNWIDLQRWITYNQAPPLSQEIANIKYEMEQRAEESTSISKQKFWISQQWWQTKAESQILEQNSNKIIGWIASNYLRGYQSYWLAHYKSYVNNMWRGKKNIASFNKWKSESLSLSRKDFVVDWKVQINLVSKNQETLENDKEFNKLIIIINSILPNITEKYPKDKLLRLLASKGNIREFDAKDFIMLSRDEKHARANLELLNLDIEVPWPSIWEDANVFLDIYSEAIDTKAKKKAILEYELYADSFQNKPQAWIEQWVWNAQVLWSAMNNENQKSNFSM